MRRIFFFCLLCIAFFFAGAQIIQTPVSSNYARTEAYSSAYVNAFTFTGNQAALVNSKSFSAGVFGERRFMLKELSSYQFVFALPTTSGHFGLQANYFGSSSYNESKLGLAYARNLSKIDVGVQFNYFSFKTAGYGTASAINFEGGAILHVNDQFQTGIHIYNPTRVSIGKNGEEKLPVMYSFGMGYDVSDKFFIGTEIEKVENQPININTGLQYSFDEKLFAKTGIASATSWFYIGLGFLLNGIRIDVTASMHPNLGMTPSLLLLYNSPEKN